jgi:hypothetical protein
MKLNYGTFIVQGGCLADRMWFPLPCVNVAVDLLMELRVKGVWTARKVIIIPLIVIDEVNFMIHFSPWW